MMITKDFVKHSVSKLFYIFSIFCEIFMKLLPGPLTFFGNILKTKHILRFASMRNATQNFLIRNKGQKSGPFNFKAVDVMP